MKRLGGWLAALAGAVFLALAAPALLALLAFVLLGADLIAWFGRKKRPPIPRGVSKDAVSVVIPTWNGRDHLARTLPSVVTALAGNPAHEILVIENASHDGTVELLAREFPSVRVVEMGSNLGFGKASNIGFSMAKHDIVVLLNNDMRVEPDFLQPLLDGFSDPRVFAVTAQIFFEDETKAREETGLTTGRWQRGRVHLAHVADEQVDALFPTFYAGGGSTAYDRHKALELGGFDELLAPFYMEDVDLGYLAWKRGWVNLYAPASVVRHEHRGTIGKYFAPDYIERVLQKNRLLFLWKNIHEWRRLLNHFAWLYLDMWIAWAVGQGSGRFGAAGFLTALQQAFRAVGRRARARRLADIPDTEALRRPLGGFFRDRFHQLESKPAGELNVLFVSPYPIEPPVHGGAVFMRQAVLGLAGQCRLHLLCLLERESERELHAGLAAHCAQSEFVLHDPRRRNGPALWPHAAQAYWDPALQWKLHRTILLRRIDIVQLEYAQLATYGETFRQVVCCLFEHDLHFQAVQRTIRSGGPAGAGRKLFEYLRALRHECRMLPKFDAVQVCSEAQRRLLRSYLGPRPPVRADLRAAVDVGSYAFRADGREPDTILFLGNFRHPPNVQALEYCLQDVLPRLRARRPGARLVVAGAAPHAALPGLVERHGAEYLGPVDDIRPVLARYAVFAAPILTGSGVRVKILEAFAAGIPVVSTTLGIEGICDREADLAEIADRPEAFALALGRLLADRTRARRLARRARKAVERRWNSEATGPRLVEHYRALLETKLLTRSAYPLPLR